MPRPLRIAMLSIHSSPLGELGTNDTGGMSVYVRELAAELGRRGHGVDIFTGVGTNGADPVNRLGPNVRLVRLEAGGSGRRLELYPHLPGFLLALEELRRTQGLSYDLIHSHYWLSGRVGAWAQGLWGVPHVVMFHTLAAAKNAGGGGEAEPPLRLAAERELAASCDRILAPTAAERDNVIRYCGVAPERIAVVPCGVNLDRFRPVSRAEARKRLGVGEGEEVVLYVGRVTPGKGLGRLVRAIGLLEHRPNLRLLVVGGDGSDEEAAGALPAVRRATFTGPVEQGELPYYYGAADVVAVPSHYESFGLVALEALACGTTVVATAVGAMEELLGGQVIRDPAPEAFARGLELVLAAGPLSEEQRNTLRGLAAPYDWARVASAVLGVYRDLLDR